MSAGDEPSIGRRVAASASRALSARAVTVGSRLRVAWLRLQYPRVELRDGVLIERGLNARLHPRARVVMRGTELRRGVVLRAGRDAELIVGRSMLGPNVVVAAARRITIGEGCLIAEMAVIRDHDHVIDPPRSLEETGLVVDDIRIGRNVWIGAKATVLKGVDIGDNAVVAAGAVVTRSVPAGALVAGVPARRVR